MKILAGLRWLTALFAAALLLLPVIWTLSISFKPPREWVAYPPRLLPEEPTLANYQVLFQVGNPVGAVAEMTRSAERVNRAFYNSLIIAPIATLASAAIGFFAAYGVSRYGAGGPLFPLAVLTTRMFPPIAFAVPLLSWVPLKSARDVKGTVATWIGYDKQIKAAIGRDWASRIKIVNQQGDPATIGAWMQKKYQYAHAMGYNEVLVAKRTVKQKYYLYSYPDFGIDWPENVMFTTEQIITSHPQVVQQFVTGHYRGFQYALANRAEAAEILVKYNKNLNKKHEIEGMDFLQRVIVTDSARANGLGYVNPASWDRLGRDMMKAGFYASMPNVKAAYTMKFPSGVKP